VWAGAGLALFARFIRVGEPGLFRRTFLASIAVPELVGFLLGIVSFPLWIELLLLPTVVLFAVLATYASSVPEAAIVTSLSNGTLSAIGLVMVAGTAVQIVFSLDTIDWHHQLLAFYLPLWLTAWSMPFVFLLGVYSRYEQAFVRLDLGAPGGRAHGGAKAALVLEFGLRVRELDAFTRARAFYHLHGAKTLSEARAIVRGSRR